MAEKETVRLNVPVPKGLRKQAKIAAMQEGVMLSEWVAEAVKERLEASDNDGLTNSPPDGVSL